MQTEAEALTEISLPGQPVDVTFGFSLEHLAPLNACEHLPIDVKTAILAQLNIADAEFQQPARFASNLPAEAATLLIEGEAAISQLRLEFSSETNLRIKVVLDGNEILKRIAASATRAFGAVSLSS
jgi:hypothetical protein